MKNLIKKTIATFILLTILSVSAFAEGETTPPPRPTCGDMQCPRPLSGDDSTSDTKDQDLEDLSSFIIKMLEQVGFFF